MVFIPSLKERITIQFQNFISIANYVFSTINKKNLLQELINSYKAGRIRPPEADGFLKFLTETTIAIIVDVFAELSTS